MTGHVRRRGGSSWEIKFELGADPLTGKRRIRYVAFKGTKRAAELELARLVAQNAAGEGVDPSKSTVAEFIERWERDWATANVGPKTLERYRQLLRLYVRPRIGAVRIQKLRAVHLNELYSTLLRSGGQDGAALSARSVGHVHRVLHRALGHAATWGVVSQNVASLVAPPPVPDEEIKILTEDQIGAILRHLEGRTLRPIVSFLLGTGARRGEALAIRWGDVNFQKNVVRIERSLEQTKGSLRVKSPKTKNGRRSVTVSPWLAAELRSHRARQDERRLALGMGRAPDDSPVFAGWNGEFRSPSRLSQDFAAAMDALNIDCTLHGLRHTHVSQLIAAGLDVLTISRRIGHASPAITLNVYSHMFSNTDTRAADIMEATFAKIRGTE
ncbi:tyrosine-type recombinase/integrase [Bradyrhizobium sp. 6(2017)]|uniref:tyrosine-type recombinase/integrase n=1 Tax=Bradyrhizobium sp. 6(2017) TaxID=1197460 RepID=UPI0013E1235B|nr:site-specific integrase [Bradyrhizobium sp. 6(2017)]QIG92160.1 site-specific integrase [Bradyrhizobium sp. 6(2017)]